VCCCSSLLSVSFVGGIGGGLGEGEEEIFNTICWLDGGFRVEGVSSSDALRIGQRTRCCIAGNLGAILEFWR
jgi:hypothetical protein